MFFSSPIVIEVPEESYVRSVRSPQILFQQPYFQQPYLQHPFIGPQQQFGAQQSSSNAQATSSSTTLQNHGESSNS